MWFFRHLIALALLLDSGDSFVNSRHHRASISQPTHPTETVLHLLQKDNDVQVADVCLLRHGESTFNALNRFCGWADVPLTEKGEEEARAAGRLIRDDPLMMGNVDVIFTSNLVRAHSTASLIAAELEGGRAQQGGGSTSTAIVQDWRLNEQMYGALTGLNKRQAMVEFGFQQVHRWRRGLAEAPPSKLFGAEWSFSSATRPGCASQRFSSARSRSRCTRSSSRVPSRSWTSAIACTSSGSKKSSRSAGLAGASPSSGMATCYGPCSSGSKRCLTRTSST